MATEEPKFKVLVAEGDFELRQMEPLIQAETHVDGSFERAGNEGFRRLAGYIFGGNQEKQKVAMTAPVGLEPEKSGSYVVTFTMPAGFTMKTLPSPNDQRVQLKPIPSRTVAVIRYSGTWSEERFQVRRDRLLEWIKIKSWKQTGDLSFARYNAPWTPWFLRRNEIMIPVDAPGVGPVGSP